MMQAFFGPDAMLLQVAAVLLIIAMIVPGERSVRLFALLSGIAALGHFVFFAADSSGLGWVIVFLIANGLRYGAMLYRSRRGLMDAHERELIENVLKVEEPAQQRRLLDLLKWRDVVMGDVLMEQGQKQPPLIYIASGAAAITHDGRQVGVCGAGDFLGEMGLLTGQGASATVTVTNSMRIASFDRDTLMRLSTAMPELSRAFDHALNRGLAAKVLRMNRAASSS
ncbi:cyclic nucleotide-binding domain-containing protein [Alteraurantiacibacter aquimixticola]|uniref:Cyclic nucleotide-binding domain-containing protein n=1 Tax=Alteraurantiacibacter aquimixticola TaxID=2489173 RepID=A0A4T3F648_9SPHN|nr:cyclic nucleotide-binding domain-containing protein [Alteraurantiacibacter aquimixticola]TIX51979.1 cyclic nucleotide-binding domain-containing protein [Alteraurantiacibacter aquimixticola]